MIQNSKFKIQRGFTLIEILVVVAIIGLLSGVILVGLNNARKQGRDARRIADLRQVQNALELYFQKNGKYPDQSTWAGMTSDLKNAGIGITNVPNDPTPTWSYGYCAAGPSGNRDSYAIGAYLEDANNPALKQDTTAPCNPTLSGTPNNTANCSTQANVTNKYCLTL